QHDGREQQVAEEGSMKALRPQRLPVPLVAHPEELVGAERILNGIVDDGHERNDGGQRDQQKHRNDEPERLVVLRLAHPSSSTRHESAKMPMRIGLNEMRGSAGISAL